MVLSIPTAYVDILNKALGDSMDVLMSYSFRVVLMGTSLLAIVAALVGSINVYKNQSLIGDAMGHSSFFGIVLAFILIKERNPLFLLFGAMFAAGICFYLVNFANKNSKIGADANMAISLSGLFGLGLVLKSYIQANPSYQKTSQAGLNNYIFGQAAYLMEADVKVIFIALLICLCIFLLFFEDFKAYIFDKNFSMMIGVNTKLLDYLILFMTILVIGVGIKAVGVILISSFLIIPTVSASKFARSYEGLLAISSIFALLAAFVGTFISTAYKGFSTGPSIIIAPSLIGFVSFVYAIRKGK